MTTRSTSPNLSGGLACVAAVLLSAAPNLVAVDKYWVNANETSASWGFTGNWSPSGVPLNTDIAIFNAEGNNGPRIIGLNNSRGIGGMIFNNTGSTAISGGDSSRQLTIQSGGITIGAEAGAVTFGEGFAVFIKPVGSQVWQNDSANLLTIKNAIRGNDSVEIKTLTVRGSGDTIFNAAITGTGDSELSLIKSGAGRLILAGTAQYTGSTTVEEGTLLVNGANAQLSSGVTVAGGTLGGDGIIGGPVTLQSGGTLSPGESIGTLTVNNTLTLDAGSATSMELDALTPTNDVVVVGGDVIYGGTLAVTNLAGTLAAGQSFPLFSVSGSRTGNFTGISPATPGPNLVWEFNPTNGTLSVVIAVVTLPTMQVTATGTNTLVVAWEGGGFRVQAQTNALDAGLSDAWFDYPDGTSSPVIVPIHPTSGSVFLRLVSP